MGSLGRIAASIARSRRARTMATYAYRNRRGIKRIGAPLLRAAKRRMFSPRQIGLPRGATTSRSYTTTNNITKSSFNSKILYVNRNLCRIPEALNNTRINERSGEMIFLSGIKLCMQYRCNTNRPLTCNLAVLTPREGRFVDDTNEGNSFFRNHAGAARAVNFSSLLSGNEMHCLPINPDRFIIHWHYRFTLGKTVTSGQYNLPSDRNYINIHKWIPIKRQIRFEGSAASAENQRLPQLFFWCNEFMDDSGSGGETNAVTYMERSVAYFRNSRP